MKPIIKLKHLPIIGAEQLNYKDVMTEIFGYKNNWFARKFTFIKSFKAAYSLVENFRQMDPTKLKWNEETCPIKKPVNVDYISFQAMMELQALMGEIDVKGDISKAIAKIIAVTCYSANHEGDYVSEGKQFEQFQKQILNHPFDEMFGLYNWIVEGVTNSVSDWDERFFSVEIEDKDYAAAGGARMSQFNVISTIKAICHDFNLPFKEAWQMSYNLVQTNSYAKATQNHIQDNMRMLKESKMNAQRGN